MSALVSAPVALGDRAVDATLDFKFQTTSAAGAPTTLSGTPALSVYKANGTTETTTGVTLTVDFDSRTGLNHVRVVLTDSFYVPGEDYQVVITTGTVDSVSVVGAVVGTFSIGRSQQFVRSATAQAGAAGTITLDASASATDDLYNDAWLAIIDGTGAGQVRRISDYVGSTKVASVVPNWATNPDNTSVFAILPSNRTHAGAIADGTIARATFAADTGLQSIRSNTAQAGAAGTITLDASASAVDDFYNDRWIHITGGTGVGQARLIDDYVGSTKVATITPNWATNPDNTSTFAVLATARAILSTTGNNAAADALLDRSAGIETGFTLRQAMRIMLSALAGKLSGGGTGTETFRDVNDSKDRIIATVDASGNRSAVTRDAT